MIQAVTVSNKNNFNSGTVNVQTMIIPWVCHCNSSSQGISIGYTGYMIIDSKKII